MGKVGEGGFYWYMVVGCLWWRWRVRKVMGKEVGQLDTQRSKFQRQYTGGRGGLTW